MPRDTLQSGTSARYIRHVPGGDGTLVGDGCPLDAGTGMIFGSNAVHLRNESLRHLFSSLGPGLVTTAKDGWSDLDEQVPDASQRTATAQRIAWGFSTAMCFGPFPVLNDDATRAVGRDDIERGVQFAVTCKSDGTHALEIYLAITTTRRPPSDASGPLQVVTTTSSSVVEVRNTGLMSVYGTPRAYLVGAAGDAGAGSVTVNEYFCWVGWYVPAGGTGYVLSAEAWENQQ